MIDNGHILWPRLVVTAVSLLFIAQSSPAAQSEIGLRLQIVQGNGRQNVVDEKREVPMSVRVTDRNNRPISGATVVFTTPDKGATGDFGGLHTVRIATNGNGLAVARNYRPNDVEGRYPILVQAEYMDELATAIMVQTNVGAKKSRAKLIAITAIAGAVGAAFLAQRGGNDAAISATVPINASPTVPTSSATVPTSSATVPAGSATAPTGSTGSSGASAGNGNEDKKKKGH